MPALKNARHERFAQELAKGETADAAYETAGFSANRGNATRLKANESVARRVAARMPVSRRGLCDHASGRIIRAAANVHARAAAKAGAQAAHRQMADLMKRVGFDQPRPLMLTPALYEQAKAEGYDLTHCGVTQPIPVR